MWIWAAELVGNVRNTSSGSPTRSVDQADRSHQLARGIRRHILPIRLHGNVRSEGWSTRVALLKCRNWKSLWPLAKCATCSLSVREEGAVLLASAWLTVGSVVCISPGNK